MKNESLQSMKRLKLSGMASAYEATLILPVNQHPPAHELVATLVDAEVQHRAQRRMELFLRTSKLRYRATLPDVQCSEDRNLQPDKLASLADGAYLTRAENILITGATGCGKSFFACALGHQACATGYRTLYFNLNRLSEQMAIAKTDGTLLKWLNLLKKAQLIILDDFGLHPFQEADQLILYDLIEDMTHKHALILTSQIPVEHWHQLITQSTLADAVMDRIIHNAHRIELKGDSMRKNTIPKN